MSPLHLLKRLGRIILPCAALLLVSPRAWGTDLGLGHLFCHPIKRCQEKPPHFKITRICPKPICDPCTLEHHGYYHTCWRPSTVPPDWSHCPVPPPAVVLLPQMSPPGAVPVTAPPGERRTLPEPGSLPAPRKLP